MGVSILLRGVLQSGVLALASAKTLRLDYTMDFFSESTTSKLEERAAVSVGPDSAKPQPGQQPAPVQTRPAAPIQTETSCCQTEPDYPYVFL